MSESTQREQALPILGRLSRAPLHLYDQFFAKVTPFDLGVARVLLYGYCFKRLIPTSEWLAFKQALFEPVGMYQWLPVFSTSTLNVLFLVAKVSALAAMLGFAYRPAAILVALIAPYLLGFDNNFGKVNHGLNVFVLSLFPMAFARAADGLSIDAYLKRRRGAAVVEPSGEYRWPVRAVWLLIAGMYCSAGISKLLRTGWEWALGDNFQRLLLRHHFTHSPPTELGVWLAESAMLAQAMALGALLLELLCPLLLLGGRWTFVFGGGLIALQGGIYLTLGVPFQPMVPVFLTLVPWEHLFRRVRLLPQPDRDPAATAATSDST